MKKIKNQSGQVIIILLLIMLVALSIGLVATQRSVTDVTTSTQTDQATRAFSAAEAGIEEAIQGGNSISGLKVGDARVSVNISDLPVGNEGLEYPPIGKEIIAQVWLADPNNIDRNPPYYGGDKVQIYFGNKKMSDQNLKDANNLSDETKPAIALTFINKDTSTTPNTYTSYKVYLDSTSRPNNFLNPISGADKVNCNAGINGYSITTTSGESSFYCNKQVTIKKDDSPTSVVCGSTGSKCVPILVRIRMLYAAEPQKIAIVPVGCGTTQPCLPKQANRYKSTGQAGRSQKTIEVFRVKKVVPPWFDFAIFSAGAIEKN